MNDTLASDLRERKSLLDVREVVTLLGVHQQTIYEWAWAGKIPHIRVGARIKFDPRALAAWIEAASLGNK